MKKYIFLFSFILLLLLPHSIARAEDKGYVQITANVDERISENKYNIVVNICESKDEGYSETHYLYYMNNYTTNITLPEGYYEISFAQVENDTENEYWITIDNPCFRIIKDKPARMYFSLGDVSLVQSNINNIDTFDNNSQAPSPTPMPTPEIEGKTKEEIEKEYEKNAGNTFEESMDLYDKDHGKTEEKEEKEEGKIKEEKKKNTFLQLLKRNVLSIIIVIIVGIAYLVVKKKGKIEEE